MLAKLNLDKATLEHIEGDIQAVEKEMDDDAESIITNERYIYIASIIKACYKKKNVGQLSTSDKIDKIVTNRWLGLPIFVAIMFLVYYISMVGVGAAATDWANDGLFGDGWHLFGIDDGYAELSEDYGNAVNAVSAFTGIEFGEEYESEEEEAAAYEAMLKMMKDFTTDETSATIDVDRKSVV